MYIQLKILEFYCTSAKSMSYHFLKCLTHYSISRTIMRLSVLGHTGSIADQVPRTLVPGFHSTQNGLVRNPIAAKCKSGTIL